MGVTKIEWADYTFNPWRGCTKVSEGCANCYAEQGSKRNPRVLGGWGKNGSRAPASNAYWQMPRLWEAEYIYRVCPGCGFSPSDHRLYPGLFTAACNHRPPRVFCASLADVFEGADTIPEGASREVVNIGRDQLFETICNTPDLNWLLLTKRPELVQNIIAFHAGYANSAACYASMLGSWAAASPPRNVWLGTSVENQARADERVPLLRACPAALRFLSAEPLLGPIDLAGKLDGIHWVIVGGESGGSARPCQVEWVEEIVSDCRAAGVAVFVKQLGKLACYEERGALIRLDLKDRKKGGTESEWPEHLRVRELPKEPA